MSFSPYIPTEITSNMPPIIKTPKRRVRIKSRKRAGSRTQENPPFNETLQDQFSGYHYAPPELIAAARSQRGRAQWEAQVEKRKQELARAEAHKQWKLDAEKRRLQAIKDKRLAEERKILEEKMRLERENYDKLERAVQTIEVSSGRVLDLD